MNTDYEKLESFETKTAQRNRIVAFPYKQWEKIEQDPYFLWRVLAMLGVATAVVLVFVVALEFFSAQRTWEQVSETLDDDLFVRIDYQKTIWPGGQAKLQVKIEQHGKGTPNRNMTFVTYSQGDLVCPPTSISIGWTVAKDIECVVSHSISKTTLEIVPTFGIDFSGDGTSLVPLLIAKPHFVVSQTLGLLEPILSMLQILAIALGLLVGGTTLPEVLSKAIKVYKAVRDFLASLQRPQKKKK